MGSTYKGPERRETPRVKVDFFVSYKVNRPTESNMWVDDEETNAQMIDLSEMGMAILTNSDIPASAILSIRFTLMNLYTDKGERVRIIDIVGRVQYNKLLENNKHRLGISFQEIAEEDKCAIFNFKKMAMNQ